VDIHRYTPKLASLFAANDVLFAYLFGSHAKGTTNSESDIDIAVWLADSVPEAEYAERLVRLNTELIGIFHQDAIDVVILNRAPPLLAFQVVRHGIVIYDPHQQHVPFYVKTFNHYTDTQPLRDVQWQYYLKRQHAKSQNRLNAPDTS
jgi:uncharacterized protein